MSMKNKVLDLMVLILAISCFTIMVAIFRKISIFIDEYNLGMSIVLGGDIWQYLYWCMGGLTLCIVGISIVNLKKRH